MSDVILINTETKTVEMAERKIAFTLLLPPLNILRLASILIEKGYGVKIIDQVVEPDWKEELKRHLRKGAICVGISSLTGVSIKFGLEASKICKDYNVKTVWGGVHPTKDPYTTIKNEYVDFVIKGEGEFSFYNLVYALDKGKELNDIKGLVFKAAGEIKETPDSSTIDLNVLPRIPFDLLDLNKYKRRKTVSINLDGLILPLETSRGCPYSCKFCSKIHNRWRAISADKIIDDLKYIRNNFTRNVMFIDENFFVDHNRVRIFLDLIKKEKIDMNFCGNPRIDYIAEDPDLLNELESCGFKTLLCALDGTSEKMLKVIDRRMNMSQILNATSRILSKKSFTVNYNLIIGFPYESIEDIKAGFLLTLKLMLENKNARVGFYRFMPTPGIGLLEDCIKYGFKKPDTLEGWATYSTFFKKQPKFPWMNDAAQEFLKKFNYIPGLYNLRMYNFPFANQIIWLFSILIKLRIKHDYYAFNFEQKIANIARYFRKER